MKAEELKRIEMEEILSANPLLTSCYESQIGKKEIGNELQNSYSLKKRWYEETVFKNQAMSI